MGGLGRRRNVLAGTAGPRTLPRVCQGSWTDSLQALGSQAVWNASPCLGMCSWSAWRALAVH